MSLAPLLYYYQRELNYLRNGGAQFAAQHPKIARRLELGPNDVADPHVERLLECFAFLTGKIQRDLDDLFPRISQNLLNVLYPHMVQPFPSVVTMHFKPDREKSQASVGVIIPRFFPLFTESLEDADRFSALELLGQNENETCWYRLANQLILYPMDIDRVAVSHPSLLGLQGALPSSPTCLHVRFEDLSGGGIHTHGPKAVTLHFSGDNRVKHLLYEALLNQKEMTVLCGDLSKGVDNMVALPRGSFQPKGFDDDESLILLNQSHGNAYRLLHEYFHYPDKFLYVEISNLPHHLCDDQMDLVFSLGEGTRLRADDVTRDNVLYGCVPAVNLFPVSTEPINMDNTQVEYRLVGDHRRESATEIHSLHKVYGTNDQDGETFELQPYFSLRHHAYDAGEVFYHSRMTPTDQSGIRGTDMLISFVDYGFNPLASPSQTIYADVLCTNRGLTDGIAAGTAFFTEGEDIAGYTIQCLDKPTRQVDPDLDGQTQWKLISHLALNHLSLENGPEGLERLREILKLHCSDPDQVAELRGLTAFSTQQIAHRLKTDAWRGFVQGTEVTLDLAQDSFTGSSAFLFSHVLSHFLNQYSSVNSFLQVVARKTNKSGEWVRWPALKGNRPLV